MIEPVLALIVWSMVMLVWLYARRLPSLIRYATTEERLETGEAVRRLPASVQWPADNYNNLMEQPTLFYAVCIAIYASGKTSFDVEYFAWLYVALRILHSLVQATVNITVIRFGLFIASSGVLCLLALSAIRLVFNF
jgi:hypothetical protein